MYSIDILNDTQEIILIKTTPKGIQKISLNDNQVESLYNASREFVLLYDMLEQSDFNPRQYGIYFKDRAKNLPDWW